MTSYIGKRFTGAGNGDLRITEASLITSGNSPRETHVMCSYLSAKGFKLPSLVRTTPRVT